MNISSKLCTAAAIVAFTVTSAFATSVTYNGSLTDNYIGKGNSSDVVGGSNYQISSINVVKVVGSDGTTTLKVDVYTAFAGQAGSSIAYGDLLFTSEANYNPTTPTSNDQTFTNKYGSASSWNNIANGSDTRWEYAFGMDNREQSGNVTDGTGSVEKIMTDDHWYKKSLNSAYQETGYSAGRKNQAVTLSGNHTTTVAGTPSTWTVTSGSHISYMFDITNTSLASADQIAFRWAMTCANDIIEGVVDFDQDCSGSHSGDTGCGGDGGGTVAEPATLGLMLIGIAGVAFTRRRRS